MTVITGLWGETMEIPNLRAGIQFQEEHGRAPSDAEWREFGIRSIVNPFYENELEILKTSDEEEVAIKVQKGLDHLNLVESKGFEEVITERAFDENSTEFKALIEHRIANSRDINKRIPIDVLFQKLDRKMGWT